MILEEIAAKTKIRVEEQKRKRSLEEIRREAEQFPHRRKQEPFAFEKALRGEPVSFICEVKKASPSKGVIAQDFPYLKIAREYEEAGASAISVLTEPFYFQGSDNYLMQIAESVKIPVLRKDFTVDAYQIYEAKRLGASAILLICALLDTDTLREYRGIAEELGMSALVEAHTEEEVESALRSGARIVGVNNRNLKTFQVDLTTTERLRSLVPPEIVFVSESGIRGRDEIERLQKIGTNAVLIGETFMRSEDKKKQLAILRGECTA